MIYLLVGLLVAHGVVCLMGAFFPFYPPVFFFYWFFPGPFVIKLIIVLVIGAAQLAYGVYLALGKKWKIRWYWPVLATIIITGLLLVYPASQGLFTQIPATTQEPPPYPSARPGPERPDDIVSTPGGPAYRANVYQQGVENPWPLIESEEVVLAEDVRVTYRDYIETKAGEARNNIVYLKTPDNIEIESLLIYTSNTTAGMEVRLGMHWYGPKTLAAQVLVIEISQGIQAGEYIFGIGIEIDGKDYGTVPCTVEVNNINKITIEPAPGSYLSAGDERSGVILKDVQIRTEACDRDYFSPWFPSVKKGGPCLVVSGHVQNQDKERFEISMSASGYDEAGETVAGTLDAAHIAGAIGLHLEYGEIGEFILHLNLSENISTIRIFAFNSLITPP